MKDSFFKIQGTSFKEEDILKEVEERIREKERAGIYDSLAANISSSPEFLEIKNDLEFMEYYLKVIKRTWAIDINDFLIPAKSGFREKTEYFIKKIIWKLLKFYTYRIFSQQIEFNSQIKNTLCSMHNKFSGDIRKLEEEIKLLKNH